MTPAANRTERVLGERAQALKARRKQVAEEPGESLLVLKSQIGDFALPSSAVVEALPLRRFTRVPGLSPWLPGVMQHRGKPVSLLDVGPLLGKPPLPKPSLVAVVQAARGSVGVVAEQLVGLKLVRPAELATSLHADTERAFIEAVTREGLIPLFDLDRLLMDPRVSGKGQ